MEQDLSVFFMTASQAKEFSYRLSQVLGKIYETNFSLEKALTDTIGVNKKDAFMALLRENNLNEISLETIKQVLEGMQRYIASLPTLSLTLPFEPSDATLRVLSEWWSVSIKREVLLDIDVDKKLIAGCLVRYKGKYKDYSIVPTFQKVVEEVLLASTKQPS